MSKPKKKQSKIALSKNKTIKIYFQITSRIQYVHKTQLIKIQTKIKISQQKFTKFLKKKKK